MADDIKKIIEEAARKTGEEVKIHFDVVAEELKGQIQQVAEGVETNSQQLERLEGIPAKLDQMDARLAAMETTLESVNLPIMKQKIETLEKRVSVLELKFST